jgi:hypothetical protein
MRHPSAGSREHQHQGAASVLRPGPGRRTCIPAIARSRGASQRVDERLLRRRARRQSGHGLARGPGDPGPAHR